MFTTKLRFLAAAATAALAVVLGATPSAHSGSFSYWYAEQQLTGLNVSVVGGGGTLTSAGVTPTTSDAASFISGGVSNSNGADVTQA